jgi:hypothetical protein
MKNELVVLDHKEYGLEETKAQEISQMFKPMLETMEALEKEYNDLTKMEINKGTCIVAKELRMKFVKVRTGTAKIHKELKDFYLQGGRFVDAFKNVQLTAASNIEQKILDIENHFENLAKIEKEKLTAERTELLQHFDVAVIPSNIGDMDKDTFDSYLLGTKLNFEERQRKAAEEAEAQRLYEIEQEEKRKAEKAEQERIRLENEELKKAAELVRIEQEKKDKIEADKRKKEAAILAKKEAEQKAILEKERAEKEEMQKALNKKLRLKKEAKEIEEAQARKAAAAPDKDKVLKFAKMLEELEKPTMATEHDTFIMEQVDALLLKVSNYIEQAAEKF